MMFLLITSSNMTFSLFPLTPIITRALFEVDSRCINQCLTLISSFLLPHLVSVYFSFGWNIKHDDDDDDQKS